MALGGLALWTSVAVLWSDSAERTATEAARVVSYLGAFLLSLLASRGGRQRLVLGGVATGICLVAGVAVASRLFPAEFSEAGHLSRFLPSDRDRLSYPINYWNGLAALCALGIPLLLAAAGSARKIAVQAAAAGSLPLVVLCVYLTSSRGGVLAGVIGLIVFLGFSGDRLAAAGTALVSGSGAAIAMAAASQRHELLPVAGSTSPQGAGSMLATIVVVCVGTALLQAAVSLIARHAHRPDALVPSPRRALSAAVATVAMLMAVATVAGGPGWASDRWSEFKTRPAVESAVEQGGSNVIGRLSSLSGRGRYEFWQEAVRAYSSRPIVGRGPGTFELWWARHRDYGAGFVRNAHSLWLETLAENGLVGLVLIAGFFLVGLAAGAAKWHRLQTDERIVLAGALGSLAVFVTSSSFEWLWQLPAISCAAIVVVAAVVVGDRTPNPSPTLRSRGLLVGIAALAAGILILPLSGIGSLRTSQAEARSGKLADAALAARMATYVQPYAAGPHLQLALVYEQAGLLNDAAIEVRRATDAEPVDWRNWVIRARIEGRAGNAAAAVDALRRARRLNRDSIFIRALGGS
jgi:hypothetical protein